MINLKCYHNQLLDLNYESVGFSCNLLLVKIEYHKFTQEMYQDANQTIRIRNYIKMIYSTHDMVVNISSNKYEEVYLDHIETHVNDMFTAGTIIPSSGIALQGVGQVAIV